MTIYSQRVSGCWLSSQPQYFASAKWYKMVFTGIFLNLVLLFFTVIFAFGIYLWLVTKKYHTIPGQLGFPIIGNVFQCVKNYWHSTFSDFCNYMNRNAEYGDFACFWFCHKVAIVASDPILVEKILDHPNLHNKPDFIMGKSGSFLKNTFWLSDTDAEWKLRRRELVSRLRKNNLDAFRDIFIGASKKAVGVWSEKPKEFNIKPYVSLLFLEATCASHFGIDVDLIDNIQLYQDVYLTSSINSNNLTNPILAIVSILLGDIFYPRTQKKFENMILDKVKNMCKELINNENNQKTNMAATIAMRNFSRETSDVDLLRELKELLYVSSHTSTMACTSGLMFLAVNPDMQEKVWQEQQDIFGESDRDPTYEDIKKMEYLDRFLKETLRFIGPPFAPREASGDINFEGKEIPEGTIFFANFQRLRFDPRYWKTPQKFDPDRFLKENTANLPNGAYCVFSIGVRNCPGANYATYFVKVFLSTIVRNFKLHSKTKFEDIKYRENFMRDIDGECNLTVERRVKNISAG